MSLAIGQASNTSVTNVPREESPRGFDLTNNKATKKSGKLGLLFSRVSGSGLELNGAMSLLVVVFTVDLLGRRCSLIGVWQARR